MPTFNYAITGAVLGAIITGPVVYGIMQSGGIPSSPPSDGEALFSYSVEEAGSRAFGDLSTVAEGSAYGRGGGGMGGDIGIDAAMPLAEGDVPTNAVDQKMMIAPGEMTEYRLVFDGEMPALTAEQAEILKRQKGMSNADVGTIMRSFNTGLIDLSSFNGARADMMYPTVTSQRSRSAKATSPSTRTGRNGRTPRPSAATRPASSACA
jgi:hypothetical protein